MSPTRRMWIDTDTASDDVVAIVRALKHPNTEVIGMSIVIGNVPVELGVQNALYTNELCGKSIPVHAGAEMPLVRPFATAQHVHGADGMGDIGLPLKGRKATSNNAVHEMIEAFRKEPGELELVALGPLTNLALAIRIEPVGKGNRTVAAADLDRAHAPLPAARPGAVPAARRRDQRPGHCRSPPPRGSAEPPPWPWPAPAVAPGPGVARLAAAFRRRRGGRFRTAGADVTAIRGGSGRSSRG